jgi:hypothetical protein
MIVLGFNLPYGKSVKRPDGKEERPPWIIGVGIGWSTSDFIRVSKGADQKRGEEVKNGNR